MFRYYSGSMSCTIRKSWGTTIKTSYRQQVVFGQCPSFVSTDTSTSLQIRSQSYLLSRKLSSSIVTSSILRLGSYTRLWNGHDRLSNHNIPQIRSEQADRAVKRETETLIRRGTWELDLEDAPNGSNIISGSSVISSKDVKTNKTIFKAILVAYGNRDAEKQNPVHDSATVRQQICTSIDSFCCYYGIRHLERRCFSRASPIDK